MPHPSTPVPDAAPTPSLPALLTCPDSTSLMRGARATSSASHGQHARGGTPPRPAHAHGEAALSMGSVGPRAIPAQLDPHWAVPGSKVQPMGWHGTARWLHRTVWPSIAVGAWSCLVPTPGPCTPCNWEPLRGLLGSMGDGVPVGGSAVLGDLGRVAAVGVAAPPTSMLELQQHLCVPLQTPLIPGRPKRRVAKIE